MDETFNKLDNGNVFDDDIISKFKDLAKEGCLNDKKRVISI